MKKNFSLLMSLLLLTLLGSGPLSAEKVLKDDQYAIHYNAFHSTLVSPEVANRHQLMRSTTRGLVNISVLQLSPDGSTTAVKAQVNGLIRNIVQQEQPLTFKEITEQKAIYSIGEFSFTHEDFLTFRLTVTPEGASKSYNIEFQQKFYVD